MAEGIYIYGIINTNGKKSFGPCGINADEEVYAFPYQDIAGVVSASSLPDLSSIFKETLGRYLIKHQQVIERIMKEHTIIPMKFGTFAQDEGGLKEVLARGYPQFKKLLTNMESKIELDVASTWNDLNSMVKKIGEEDKEISQFKAEIAKKPPQETFEDRIKIGAMISEALGKKREKEKAEMINFLKGIILDYREHEVMNDQMILNCGFLLEEGREKEFENGLEELNKKYNEKVNFKCVGPLPPYSFATCQLEKVAYHKIDEARRLLGLEEKISLEKVKESYREWVKKNHPDKDPDSKKLEEEFEKITEAYKLLSSCCREEALSLKDRGKEDFIMVEVVRPEQGGVR